MSFKKPAFLKPDDSDDLFSTERAEQQNTETTNFIFNSNKSLSLQSQRDKLPIRKHRNEIIYCLENYQTLILAGEIFSIESLIFC
jgi:ATP-dependent RNA helicase DDX35